MESGPTGHEHSILSMWQFLRTVLTNKRIANAVTEVDIRDWTLGLVYRRGRLALGAEDFNLIRSAMRDLGYDERWDSFEIKLEMDGLRKADPTPLVALILASLPNLVKLCAHLPREGSVFLRKVMGMGTGRRQDQGRAGTVPFSGLHELCVASPWTRQQKGRGNSAYNYVLHEGAMRKTLELPALRRLDAFDVCLLGIEFLRDHPRSSPITDLTLVQHQHLPMRASGLQTFLSLPKALVSLSINMKEKDFVSMFPENHFSNTDLWNCIQQLKGPLERLDVYLDCKESFRKVGDTIGLDHAKENRKTMHLPQRSHFGLMREFQRLQSLSIQPEMLLGGCCEGEYAPFQLKNTLPAGLRSLTLYGDEGLYGNKALPQQLQDALSGTGFRQLMHITLEQDTGFHAYSPHEEVRRVCEMNGIRYEARDSKSCYKGGRGHPYRLQLEERRVTVQTKMGSIRHEMRLKQIRIDQWREGIRERWLVKKGISLDEDYPGDDGWYGFTPPSPPPWVSDDQIDLGAAVESFELTWHTMAHLDSMRGNLYGGS
jgi:hypothetical protein